MAKQNTQVLFDIGQGLSVRVGLTRIAFWDISDRPKKPKRGTFGFNSQINNLEYFDGTDWWTAQMSKK